MNASRDIVAGQFQQGSGTNPSLLKLGVKLKEYAYRFTAVTPATHERVNRRPGNEWAHELAGVFGWSRPFLPSSLPAEIVSLMREADIVEHLEGNAMRSRLRASSLRNDLFFHSAYPTTDIEAIFFGPDTYRFATAINRWFDTQPRKPGRAIDLCCGGAPGAITVARHCPDAEILASDINHRALSLAATNIALAGTSHVKPCLSNLLRDVTGNFDLIVANPPYLVDPSKRAYRHGGGQFGAGLSLDILAASLKRLNAGGTLLLYTGSAIVRGTDLFREAVEDMLRDAPVQWHYRETDPDVFGEELLAEAYVEADRVAAVVLEVTASA